MPFVKFRVFRGFNFCFWVESSMACDAQRAAREAGCAFHAEVKK
jgi:hypothetical protein